MNLMFCHISLSLRSAQDADTLFCSGCLVQCFPKGCEQVAGQGIQNMPLNVLGSCLMTLRPSIAQNCGCVSVTDLNLLGRVQVERGREKVNYGRETRENHEETDNERSSTHHGQHGDGMKRAHRHVGWLVLSHHDCAPFFVTKFWIEGASSVCL